jgi:hypothetical protein
VILEGVGSQAKEVVGELRQIESFTALAQEVHFGFVQMIGPLMIVLLILVLDISVRLFVRMNLIGG